MASEPQFSFDMAELYKNLASVGFTFKPAPRTAEGDEKTAHLIKLVESTEAELSTYREDTKTENEGLKELLEGIKSDIDWKLQAERIRFVNAVQPDQGALLQIPKRPNAKSAAVLDNETYPATCESIYTLKDPVLENILAAYELDAGSAIEENLKERRNALAGFLGRKTQ